VLGAVVSTLAAGLWVRVLDPAGAPDLEGCVRTELRDRAGVYLLRSHDAAGIRLARELERAGALVVNGWAATAACRDRVEMGRRLREGGLPCPEPWRAADLGALAAGAPCAVPYPAVVKSRWSRRGDLVRRVDSDRELLLLAGSRPREEVVVQPLVASDGSDCKLYVVEDRVAGVRQASPLERRSSIGNGRRPDRVPVEVPRAWCRLALEVGRAFGLRVYGVDLIRSPDGPVIVDVNPFPGFRGVPGAAGAIVAMVGRLLTRSRPGGAAGG